MNVLVNIGNKKNRASGTAPGAAAEAPVLKENVQGEAVTDASDLVEEAAAADAAQTAQEADDESVS